MLSNNLFDDIQSRSIGIICGGLDTLSEEKQFRETPRTSFPRIDDLYRGRFARLIPQVVCLYDEASHGRSCSVFSTGGADQFIEPIKVFGAEEELHPIRRV